MATTQDIQKIAAAYDGLHSDPNLALTWDEHNECTGFILCRRKGNGTSEALREVAGTKKQIWLAIKELGRSVRRPNSGPKVFDTADALAELDNS